MAAFDVLGRRLRGQRIVGPLFERPAEVVRWLGAVQAQDYLGSLWGIGLRTRRALESDVERAIADRSIVRTWPMRGTLHFVAAEDVRWMLRLLTPRVAGRVASRHRQLGLDAATFGKSQARLEGALSGGRALTRPEVYAVLERSGVATNDQRGIHILAQLAMEGVLCFGARRGRQPTFTLLEEWVPTQPTLDRDEALGELAVRYFTSHGPATLHDFAWWSGLSVADTRRAVEVSGEALAKSTVGASVYLGAPSGSATRRASVGHLLPPYDEYTVAYRERSAFLDPALAVRTRNGIFSPVVMVGGRIVGTWRRRATRDLVVVTADLFEPPSRAVRRRLETVVERYGGFLGRPASLEVTSTSPQATALERGREGGTA